MPRSMTSLLGLRPVHRILSWHLRSRRTPEPALKTLYSHSMMEGHLAHERTSLKGIPRPKGPIKSFSWKITFVRVESKIGVCPTFWNPCYLPGMRSILKNLAVWVAALGYFVDIYDLLLFSIIRVPSLESLGVEKPVRIRFAHHQHANVWTFARRDSLGCSWGPAGPNARPFPLHPPLLRREHCEWLRSQCRTIHLDTFRGRHWFSRRIRCRDYPSFRTFVQREPRPRHIPGGGHWTDRGGGRFFHRPNLRLAHVLLHRRWHGIDAACPPTRSL